MWNVIQTLQIHSPEKAFNCIIKFVFWSSLYQYIWDFHLCLDVGKKALRKLKTTLWTAVVLQRDLPWEGAGLRKWADPSHLCSTSLCRQFILPSVIKCILKLLPCRRESAISNSMLSWSIPRAFFSGESRIKYFIRCKPVIALLWPAVAGLVPIAV